ncbi:histidine kinase [Paenibacillus swuensis]|uniref:histidine kinase n=1 Tax=Paenibacillus swuensis TaxID=1178515 RepID=A0A172TN78_9BACL|nr:ATP-binding protein [Paenibacillus swuensis]ANE48432.1 histidine kinase [Paenibacillus swuensis]
MMKFRVRLTLIFIVLIGLSVLACGIFMARMFNQAQLESLKDNLVREGKIIMAQTDWLSGGTEKEQIAYYTSNAQHLRAVAEARVTFIREDGKVLGDSDNDPTFMDNHGDRLEVIQAKAKGVGSSTRFSATLKKNMLYVAVPVQQGADFKGYVRLSMSLEDVEARTRLVWFYLIVGLFIFFSMAGMLSYRIAHSLTRPLEKITRVANQITHMNYKSRVFIKNVDEIGQLGNAINTMADSLQFQMNRIQEDESRLKSVLENMISGVVMIDREGHIVLLNRSAEEILGFNSKELLGKTYDQAKQQYEMTQIIQECMEKKEHIRDELTFYFPEERILEINLVPMYHSETDWAGIVIVLHDISAIRRLERVRSEFVANVSHELKTPIAAVKGFAETLLAGAVNDEETARSFLQIIHDESDRLNRLIVDILELSKVESKRIPLYFSPIQMQPFILNTIDVMQTEAKRKQIDMDMHVDENLYLEADEDRLQQILINLLANGINYTPEGGKITVTAEAVDTAGNGEYDHVQIVIQDTGVGIPKKDIPRIFERFYRVDKARSRSSGGTGLGLSIVKHLVELHRGTIRVESSLGAGSRFIIELPVVH